MTRRLVRHIEEHSIRKTFTAVADEVGVDEKTVRNLFKSYVERLATTTVFDTPEWIGMDEVHLLKKPRAVFTNIKERTIIAVLEKRTKKVVLAHLKAMPDKERVEVVTMDMWNPYYDAVQVSRHFIVLPRGEHQYAVNAKPMGNRIYITNTKSGVSRLFFCTLMLSCGLASEFSLATGGTNDDAA